LEPRHTRTVILDSTPPVATISTPEATAYGHNVALTLDYGVSDGAGSGVKSFTPLMDGQTETQFGASLQSGQTLYLYSMPLGTHTFTVNSLDNVLNAGTKSIVFSITVTPDSLKGDVTDLTNLGCIDNISQSLTAHITSAQNLIGKGQIQAAINTLSALILEVQAQAGKHIATTCKDPSGRTFNSVQLLIGDTQYLIGLLAGQLKPDPVAGWVTTSDGLGLAGVTVNLMSSAKSVAATMVTDSSGFYYFADVSGLVVGSSYTLNVAVPNGFKTSLPASQAFTWTGSAVKPATFILK
jgi:hypothetical protein